jgi:hypothetical protein
VRVGFAFYRHLQHPPDLIHPPPSSHAKRFLPWRRVILKVCSFRVLCNVRAETSPSIFSLRTSWRRWSLTSLNIPLILIVW